MAREPSTVLVENPEIFSRNVQRHLTQSENYDDRAKPLWQSLPIDGGPLGKIRDSLSAGDSSNTAIRFAIKEIMKILLANSRTQGGKRKSRRHKKSHHRKRRHTRRS